MNQQVCEKVGYPTHKLVQDAVAKISAREKDKLRSYKCKECGMFHIATARRKGRSSTQKVKPIREEIPKPKHGVPKKPDYGPQRSIPYATEKVFQSLLNIKKK